MYNTNHSSVSKIISIVIPSQYSDGQPLHSSPPLLSSPLLSLSVITQVSSSTHKIRDHVLYMVNITFFDEFGRDDVFDVHLNKSTFCLNSTRDQFATIINKH